MPFDNMPPLPPGKYQSLATDMGQPQMSYAFNPTTDNPEYDVSMLGEDVMGTPMDRSMGDMGMGMPMGMEMEPGEGMEMEDEGMQQTPENRDMAIAALQQKATQKQASSDMFQANATKLASTMRGPQAM